MSNDVTIYKCKKSLMWDGVFLVGFVFVCITLPILITGEQVTQGKIIGQSIFYAIAVMLTVLPLGSRLEVGKDYVKWRVFGIRTGYLRAADVEEIKYRQIIRWGAMSMGMGLAGWSKTFYGHSYFSFTEKGFGKDAIMHVKRVLEQYLSKSPLA